MYVSSSVAVFRTPRRSNGSAELAFGLNPANHTEDDRSAYVGSESVARDYANPKVGTHENGYIRFDMDDAFRDEFAPYLHRYDRRGPDRWEYAIPYELIGRFNELTMQRTWIEW